AERAGVSADTVRLLARKEAIELFDREVRRSPVRYYGGEPESTTGPDATVTLTEGQQTALEAIEARLLDPDPARRAQPLLVEGVTGSGKTEVYLRAIRTAVDAGGTAIVLVPEISLTYQAVRRFQRRFGDRVGVLHSGLSLGERHDEHARIAAGEVDVVIGPRSAVFAPIPRLRLIVVDEENDSSFKQENEPRYDARRVAAERARQEGASLVLGSATPSVETRHEAADRFVLPERATGAAMPPITVVDMREEEDSLFSRELLRRLDRNIAAGNKSILMLNSRGYARFLQCSSCGHVWKCANCDISLTVHAAAGCLVCHHCGHSVATPAACPECAGTEIRRWGTGTEKLEREVRRLFPEAPVLRLDADTARGYGEAPRLLAEFGRTPGAVLVGTQMVAKGHHFPDVTLAAVMNADLALAFPEFRAEERTYALIMQLAGRSGRAELPGEVLIQTWNAEIECIRMAADQAAEDFYAAELGRRRLLGYPPFTSLINVVCLARDEEKPLKAAGWLKQKLEPVLGREQLLGPAELFRLKGWSRGHFLIKTPGVEETLAAAKPVLEDCRGKMSARGVRLVVDVDPQWLS
ncbi:MAG: primosomal protein N', partial [Pseudomonadota bacterium]